MAITLSGVKKFSAGSLRTPAVLEEDLGGTADDYGERAHNWNIVEWLWAMVVPLTGQELVIARQVVPTVTHLITLRQPTAAAPGKRIRVEDSERSFYVEAVYEDLGIGRTLQLLCREEV